MAEPIWDFEKDLAPLRRSYFSDVAPTYSTPDARRYAAAALAPSQAALRQAEEDRVKREEQELAFKRNRLLLEQAQTEARQQAEVLAMEPKIQDALAPIQALVNTDPESAQTKLADYLIKNPAFVSQSGGAKLAVEALGNAINYSVTNSRNQDQALLNQVVTWAGADTDTAANFVGQIKNPDIRAKAMSVVASTIAVKSKAEQEKKEKEDKAKREKEEAANLRKYSAMFSDVKSMSFDEPRTAPSFDSARKEIHSPPSKPPSLKREEKIRLTQYAQDLGLSLGDYDDDESLYRAVVGGLTPYISVDVYPNGSSVGTVTGSMMPSSP